MCVSGKSRSVKFKTKISGRVLTFKSDPSRNTWDCDSLLDDCFNKSAEYFSHYPSSSSYYASLGFNDAQIKKLIGEEHFETDQQFKDGISNTLECVRDGVNICGGFPLKKIEQSSTDQSITRRDLFAAAALAACERLGISKEADVRCAFEYADLMEKERGR